MSQVSFYETDHLGNNRIVFSPRNFLPNGDIIKTIHFAADYYPYGKTLRYFETSMFEEKYLTTQHERDRETGFDYRGARYYDSDLGRFLSLDPLASQYPAWSDYNYVLGNPIMLIDPDGREAKETKWTNNHKIMNEAFGMGGFNELINLDGKTPPTKFVDEYGNTIVETNDGSDQIFVVERKNKDSFIEELKNVVDKREHENAKKNSELGMKFGYKIEDIFENRLQFKMNSDNATGYLCGYTKDPIICGAVSAIQAQGKGSGVVSYSKAKGISDKAKGLMSAVIPEPKNNPAQFKIESYEKVIIKSKDPIKIQKMGVIKKY